MTTWRTGVGALVVTILTGCRGSVADISTISFDSSSYDVDSNCTGGCGETEILATVSFAQNISAGVYPAVRLQQYKIEYALPSLVTDDADGMPFFAAELAEQAVDLDQSATFSVQAAGSAQRAWVYALAGSALVSGTAVLHMEGYDHRNDVVEIVSDPFDITFSDLSAEDAGAGGLDSGIF